MHVLLAILAASASSSLASPQLVGHPYDDFEPDHAHAHEHAHEHAHAAYIPPLTEADQLPFPFVPLDPLALNTPVPPQQPHRVAIVGAGAGGSSAAFWLGKARERLGLELELEVDVYERSDYIGGRSTTVQPHDDPTFRPVELGASIFVTANKNLERALKEFNLTRDDFHYERDYDTGIWNGQELLLTIAGRSGIWGWWETFKLVWRYGWSAPTKTQNIVKDMIADYVKLYLPTTPTWTSIEQLASKLGFEPFVASTTAEYLDAQAVGKKFSREMVEAATRVNYGQNVDRIHALEGLCSMAATGASAVRGGNWQIFERFLKHSQARVMLNTTVTNITRDSSTSRWTLHSHPTKALASDDADVGADADAELSATHARTYDSIILAAPYHTSNLHLPAHLASLIPPQPYIHLHVTLLTTSLARPLPAFFGLPDSAEPPHVVLTTTAGSTSTGSSPVPEFNSVSWHGDVGAKSCPGGREVPVHVVKIFSDEKVDFEAGWFKKMFGARASDPNADLCEGGLGWVYRKEWDAYPVLPPTTRFPPVKLDDGLYYVNAFEPFISTMETETVAARGVVEMLLRERFGAAGVCGDYERNSTLPVDRDYVFGWDC